MISKTKTVPATKTQREQQRELVAHYVVRNWTIGTWSRLRFVLICRCGTRYSSYDRGDVIRRMGKHIAERNAS